MATAIPLIIAAVGTGVSIYQANQSSRAQKEQYAAQARANAYNEAVLRERAEQAASAANQREEQLRVSQRLDRGKRLAFIAQSHTGFEGTNLDVERQNDILGELDALNVRYQGQLEAQGLLSQAGLERMYQGTNLQSATTARRLGYVSMAGSALSGASSMYGKSGGVKLGDPGNYSYTNPGG